MDLNFTKQGGAYAADFEATSDFNLHLEGIRKSGLTIYQSGVQGGAYDLVKDADTLGFTEVLDCDFTAVVWPKYIRIVSDVKPTAALVTYNA